MKHNIQSIAAFSMIILRAGAQYLLLRRASWKRFSPNKWTGIGGRIEPDEFGDLVVAAAREITEETGLTREVVRNLTLRRTLIHNREAGAVTVLIYFTGDLDQARPLHSDEGELVWLTSGEIGALDLIDNAELVIPLLLQDMDSDVEEWIPRTGAAHYGKDGRLESIVWSDSTPGTRL